MTTEIGNADERVYESFVPDFQYLVAALSSTMTGLCDSPIEVMLATSFVLANRITGHKIFEIVPKGQAPESQADFLVHPQFEWEGYRMDFCIEMKAAGQKVFIECDGHDFHERTPEQAERDRKKDRLAQDRGISILRYTGREIHRSPAHCVSEIIGFLQNRLKAKDSSK